MVSSCIHEKGRPKVTPSGKGCKECLAMGDTWVELRLCFTCGHVGCCDNSKNKHTTKHWEATGHPVVQSFQPGENWKWCFVEKIFIDPTVRCQSCGMPLTDQMRGTEKDGKQSADYCKLCFQNGNFTEPNLTANEMSERTFKYLTTQMHLPEEKAKGIAYGMIPQLKRWSKS